MAGPSAGRLWITGRIRDMVPGPERLLTRSGEPVKRKTTVDTSSHLPAGAWRRGRPSIGAALRRSQLGRDALYGLAVFVLRCPALGTGRRGRLEGSC
jgi:hypothetical protein